MIDDGLPKSSIEDVPSTIQIWGSPICGTIFHPGLSSWQLRVSYLLRTLGADSVGDLQSDAWWAKKLRRNGVEQQIWVATWLVLNESY